VRLTRPRPGSRPLAALLAGLVLPVALPVAVPAPASAEDVSCLGTGPDDPAPSSETASAPLAAIGAVRAQDWLRRTGRAEAGDGTTVAIVSSGIAGAADLPVVGGTSVVGAGPVTDPTGTVVAGLVAGAPRSADLPVGVAPAAGLLDVRVYDTATPSQEGQDAPSAAALADGLAWVRGQSSVDVVVVPLQLPRDDRVDELVADLVGDGVLVVAQSGDRPDDLGVEDGDSLTALATPAPGEDAGPVIHPAAVPGVVAVGPEPEEISGDPLRSSAIDVVAPSLLAVSTSLAGGTCVVDEASSAWSAGLVGGVLAMLRSAFPQESPEELVARLVGTADGRPDVPSPLTGAGRVQAFDALTATPGELRSGGYAGDTTVPASSTTASPPEEPADLLAGTRGSAVWWGLVGGAALLLSLLLRPLLARRPR
jgi:membrane-anchored mycosin MYCP